MNPEPTTIEFFFDVVDPGFFCGHGQLTVSPDGSWAMIVWPACGIIPIVAMGDRNAPCAEAIIALLGRSEVNR